MEQMIEFIGNHPILSLLWVGIAFMLVMSIIKSKFSAIRQINPAQLSLLVNREDAKVIDIRATKEFNSGRIAGAIHLSADKAKAKDFASVEKFKSTPIVLVCAQGITAGGIADLMHKAGFERVYVLSGGMSSWQSAGLPLSSGRE